MVKKQNTRAAYKPDHPYLKTLSIQKSSGLGRNKKLAMRSAVIIALFLLEGVVMLAVVDSKISHSPIKSDVAVVAKSPKAKPKTEVKAVSEPALPAPALAVSDMSLVIPKLFINAPIDPVGLNTKGEMATSPSLQRLAWYKEGAAPGQIGSAVFAGHYGGPNEIGVFRSLDQLKNGDVLEVKSKAGKIQKYSVYNIGKYALADVPLQELFNKNDGKYLNLVTCVGTWSNGTSSYDQRYIVFSRLVE